MKSVHLRELNGQLNWAHATISHDRRDFFFIVESWLNQNRPHLMSPPLHMSQDAPGLVGTSGYRSAHKGAIDTAVQ